MASSTLAFVQNAAKQVNTVRADSNVLVKSYDSIRDTTIGLTGGLVKLPPASNILSKLSNNSGALKTVLKALGLGDYIGDINHVLISSAEADKGDFKWVEMTTTPDSFASAEHTIIFAGEPIYANNTTGREFVPIGMCQGFQFSSSIGVTPLKELRCEENYIIPGKAGVGTLVLSRFLGNYPSLSKRVHLESGYGFNTQSASIKPLFGILLMFLNPSREKTISTLYFERCSIQSVGANINASDYSIVESISVTYGKCITVGEATIASTVSDTETTTEVVRNILNGDLSDFRGAIDVRNEVK